jgi:amidase
MISRVRRSLLLMTLLALLLGVSGAAAHFGHRDDPTNTKVAWIDVDETTIPQLQKLMDRGRLSSRELTRFYLRRIRQLNPILKAVITVSPTARADARAADRARRKGDDRPLLGIPIIVKDNINTTGMPTTAGSWALAGSTPDDAFIVKQLKAAGAIIIGKANLSEWANWRSIPSSSGWSGIGGQGNSPYVLDRNPCGSSSGSGVVAAADLAVAAVGTETDGSIVCPAGANGVVGIKPTLGLWSREGIVPISANQDTAGPMARNVTDAAVLLGAATGIDENDPATADQKDNAFSDYTEFLDDDALEGARIGVWRDGTFTPGLTGPVIEPILDDAIEALEDEGATVVEDMDIDLSATAGGEPGEPPRGEFAALLCESKTDIANYLQTYAKGTNPVTGQPYPQTLAELIAFNEAHPELEGPWNNAIFELADATKGRDPEGVCAGIRAGVTPPVQEAIDTLMKTNDLDAIIALTNGPAWPTNSNPEEGDLDGHFEYFVGSSSAAAVSGYADITVPAGFIFGRKHDRDHGDKGDDQDHGDKRDDRDHGDKRGRPRDRGRHAARLPIGVTFIGGRWSEDELIGFAYDFEQATEVRVPPRFIRTIGDDLFPGVPNPPEEEQAQRQQATQAQRQQATQAQRQQATQAQRDLVVRSR